LKQSVVAVVVAARPGLLPRALAVLVAVEVDIHAKSSSARFRVIPASAVRQVLLVQTLAQMAWPVGQPSCHLLPTSTPTAVALAAACRRQRPPTRGLQAVPGRQWAQAETFTPAVLPAHSVTE
jgi:hypothetical protein